MSVLAIVFALIGVACMAEANVSALQHERTNVPVGTLFLIGAAVIGCLIATGAIAR